MDWKLTVLGSSSALPAEGRMLSAQLLSTARHHLLFDCGEGTQFQMRRFKAPLNKIDSVFLTHAHGDHFFGIFGLLSTFSMYRREKALKIFAPPEIISLIPVALKTARLHLGFDLDLVELQFSGKTLIFEDSELKVYSIPLKHSVPVCGFLVEEVQRELNIKKEFVQNRNIPFSWFPRIKKGEDYIDEEGSIFPNKEITYRSRPAKSYAYISDTAYLPQLAKDIKGVALLYHEATFAQAEIADAVAKLHSTAAQAADIARRAGAVKLLIGHFSSRYSDTAFLQEEAREIFNDSHCVYDGMEVYF